MTYRPGHIVKILAGWFLVVLLFGPALAENAVERLVSPGPVAKVHEKFEKDCASCHKAFSREAQSELCADCHKDVKNDLARGAGFHGRDPLVRKTECAMCHTDHRGRDFNPVRINTLVFNHDLTDYRLDGRHVKVACGECHAKGQKYRVANSTCFACHEKDQPHFGRLGNKCESCHNSASWQKVAAFDHDKTEFKLLGAHQKVACLSCHLGEIYKGVTKSCNGCHAIQDVHLGRFKAECSDCHSNDSWKKAKFDHGKFTKFALEGAHGKAQCEDCHGPTLTSKLPVACFECHKKQDVHLGQLGQDCASCHGVTAWRRDVKFDHDLTRYPLTGMHAVVACESCHATPAFKTVATDCFDCHKKDDVHEGRLTSKCESCHGTASWARVSFNHDTDTKYPLTGAHKAVGCHGCHTQKNVSSAKIATACISCHKKDDVHRGAFGTDCARCHSTVKFKPAFIRK